MPHQQTHEVSKWICTYLPPRVSHFHREPSPHSSCLCADPNFLCAEGMSRPLDCYQQPAPARLSFQPLEQDNEYAQFPVAGNTRFQFPSPSCIFAKDYYTLRRYFLTFQSRTPAVSCWRAGRPVLDIV